MNTIDIVNDLNVQMTEFIPSKVINKMSFLHQLQCIEWHYNPQVLKKEHRIKTKAQYDNIISIYEA